MVLQATDNLIDLINLEEVGTSNLENLILNKNYISSLGCQQIFQMSLKRLNYLDLSENLIELPLKDKSSAVNLL